MEIPPEEPAAVEEEPAAGAGEDDGTLFPYVPPPMTLSELESHLAKAADLLRGTVDQADFKAYIFPLMFFKRISDVYLEEYDQALAESVGTMSSRPSRRTTASPSRTAACGRTCAPAARTSGKR